MPAKSAPSHNRYKDGCPADVPCATCDTARSARSNGDKVWSVCTNGSSVRTFNVK